MDLIQTEDGQAGYHVVLKGVGADHVVVAGSGGGSEMDGLTGVCRDLVLPVNAGGIFWTVWNDCLAKQDLQVVSD